MNPGDEKVLGDVKNAIKKALCERYDTRNAIQWDNAFAAIDADRR